MPRSYVAGSFGAQEALERVGRNRFIALLRRQSAMHVPV
jgi:hypothetical protein